MEETIERRMKELQIVKDIITQTMEEYEMSFGETCGMFRDIELDYWHSLRSGEDEEDES